MWDTMSHPREFMWMVIILKNSCVGLETVGRHCGVKEGGIRLSVRVSQ